MPSVLNVIAGRTQQRRVVENKKGETVHVPEGSGLLVTGCSDCVIDAPGRSSSVTVERCEGTTVNLGSVVASIEVIHCAGVQVSVARCRTITVDVSTDVHVSCKCQPPSEQQQPRGGGEGKVHPSDAADEATAIRLFTSCSERVSVAFEGLGSPPPPPSPPGDPTGGDSAAAAAVTYHVPKDFRYEKGDGPRSVSRTTVDGAGGSTCKTLRCDQYGNPLEEVEAAKAGVPWTWEHGRAGAGEVRPGAAAAAQSEES